MAFPRMFAAGAVLLLIGLLSIVSIVTVMTVGPATAHGNNVQHMNGKVHVTGLDRDFILTTATGQKFPFQCRDQCRASKGHLQRHEIEKANTDVYFKQGPNNALLVIDVD